MKKYLPVIVFFVFGVNAFAQVDSVSLKEAMKQLDDALINKKETVLQQLLHKELSFGHSNGWVQTKKEVLDDMNSGKLIYKKIENISAQIVAINKKWATVRINTNAEGTVNGNEFKLSLHVLQVWQKTKKGWQLIARQSTKT